MRTHSQGILLVCLLSYAVLIVQVFGDLSFLTAEKSYRPPAPIAVCGDEIPDKNAQASSSKAPTYSLTQESPSPTYETQGVLSDVKEHLAQWPALPSLYGKTVRDHQGRPRLLQRSGDPPDKVPLT